MYLFPAIDIIGGQVVRLLKGAYGQQTTYGSDPLSQAKQFADAGASYLHVVDLDGARTGEPTNLPIVEQVCRETGLIVEVGGGVRDEQTIDRLLRAGVQRIVLGTAALTDWPWFERLAHRSDLTDRLVLGLDARKGRLAIGGWERTIETTALEIAQRVAGWPLAGIVYTDIATDGTLEGPNLDSTRQIAEATDVPVVASGGVGTLEHLRALQELPIFGAIVGRALYEQRFTIGEALAVFEN